MKKIGLYALLLCWGLAFLTSPLRAQNETNQDAEPLYPENRAPLAPKKFSALPLGAVRPEGWLLDQLKIQANGLTGYLDEFWPDLKNSRWRGMEQGDGWERGPYYLDGLVPLAWILDDARLKQKATSFLDYILTSGKEDGRFGPENDTWPNSVAMKVLCQYYEATGDERALDVMTRYFHYLKNNKPELPDFTWHGMRAMETVLVGYWLYNRTGDPEILDVVRDFQSRCFDWRELFRDFPYTTLPVPLDSRQRVHESHVVNIAMSLKNGALYYQLDPNDENRQFLTKTLATLDKYHGQAGGRFSGDEQLSGTRPTQGSELCSIVEAMFSYENHVEVFGDVEIADRLEFLAYNGNPGTCTPDYWAHQYDQQANQVLVNVAKRDWSNNNDTANLYGLEPHYGCCTANMHQGWPKFVSHLWMASPDRGLAAIAYGPSTVTGKVADGQSVTITEKTDYPFDGSFVFNVETEGDVEFPLYLRIPAWSKDVSVMVGEKSYAAEPGTFLKICRVWRPGDEVRMTIPMTLRTERRHNNAVSIYRGPLLTSLRIGERFEKIRDHAFQSADWNISPTTPWNYGLILNDGWEQTAEVEVTKPGPVPFANADAPVVLRLQGRRLPSWKLENNSAGETPVSPATSNEPEEQIELIPYGCTRLRITEFPVLARP